MSEEFNKDLKQENAAGTESRKPEENKAQEQTAGSQPAGGTTYSWVNPKLQHGTSEGGKAEGNPWSGGSAQNWRTETGSAGQTGQAQSSQSYSGQSYAGQQAQGSQSYSGQQTQGSQSYSGQSYGSQQTQNSQRQGYGSQQARSGQSYTGQQGQGGQNQSYGGRQYQGTGSAAGSASGQSYQYSTYQTGHDAAAGTGKKARKVKANKVKKPRKPMSTGKKWAVNVAMALVFGLVAGTAFYGVNAAVGQFSGNSSSSASLSTPIANTDTVDDSATTPVSSTTGSGTVASVVENAMPSLVTISTMTVEEMQSFFGGTQQYEVEGAGTGVIVGQNDSELLIATNNHVVNGATSLSVGFIDETTVEAQIKGTDASSDLAVVSVNLSDIPEETMSEIKVATIGNSDDLVLGEQVVAIGNALGYGQSVTSGYVSALDRDVTLSDGAGGTFTSTGLIQTDAPINSGNSGGALLNMRGELVGINEAKSSMTSSGTTVDGIGFAIPIAKAEPILEDLMSLTTRDKVSDDEASYLGVTCADVTSEISQMYNMPTGVCFTSVIEDGPAAQAGAKQGDVLTEFDGREISDYNSLTSVLQYYAAGETVDLVVQRSNAGEYQEITLTVTLGSAADAPQETQSNN